MRNSPLPGPAVHVYFCLGRQGGGMFGGIFGVTVFCNFGEMLAVLIVFGHKHTHAGYAGLNCIGRSSPGQSRRTRDVGRAYRGGD